MLPIRGARRLLVALAVLGLLCGAVLAQHSAPPEMPAEAPGGGHGSGGGIPIFDPETGTAIWALITFILLLIVLWWFVWPHILSGLDQRERTISEAVESAERTNAEAREILARYEAQLDGARSEAQEIIDEAKTDAAKVRDDILAKGWQEAEKIKQRATREVELAADRSRKELYREMAHLSTEIAGRILREKLDPAGQERLVDLAISEIQSARPSQG